MDSQIKQYAVVTGAYWGFTLTDGALRMLVVLYFHQLGYSPINIAFLFLFYELFGIFTNLFGGWLGALIGLNRTMFIGLLLQITALALLSMETWLSMAYVMVVQALSGIGKDLNKMSAKSA
ncbi:MAG: sugar phosphate permease, partial [Phenylobacterium sp.]